MLRVDFRDDAESCKPQETLDVLSRAEGIVDILEQKGGRDAGTEAEGER